MMMPIVFCIVLAVAAFLDGYTTLLSLAKGNIEADPLAVWLFGTDTPSAKVLWSRGMGFIGIEIAAMLYTAYHHPSIAWLLCALALSQAGIHFYLANHNYKLAQQ